MRDEIPKEFKEAWQESDEYRLTIPVSQRVLADAFLWSVAKWWRIEWESEHREDRNFYFGCRRCSTQTKPDPRHTWTVVQWQADARKEMEAK